MNATERKLPETAACTAGGAAVPVVFVVDDDISVRAPLQSLIRKQGWEALTFPSAAEFLALPPITAPCCLLSEVNLPDVNGLDLQQRVSHRTGMPVIFITYQTDVQTTVRAMKAGAFEYLIKPFRNEVLLSAISFALERSSAVLNYEAAVCALRKCYASLSRREREVMELVVSGWLNKQIGAALGVSEITVKAHRGKMMRKMKAESLPDLVKMAATLGVSAVPRTNNSFFRALATYTAVRDRSQQLSWAMASASA